VLHVEHRLCQIQDGFCLYNKYSSGSSIDLCEIFERIIAGSPFIKLKKAKWDVQDCAFSKSCFPSNHAQNCDTSKRIATARTVTHARVISLEAPYQFVTAFTAEWNRLAAEATAGRDGIARDLATTERKLKGRIEAIADGFRAPGLQAELDELEVKKIMLKAKLEAPAPTTPRLHPNLAELYRAKVQTLPDALPINPSGSAALETARALTKFIEISPEQTKQGFEIELIREIATMLRFGIGIEHHSTMQIVLCSWVR
jgi:hypothetical protein